MRASIVRISIPIRETRTYASITRPLSRITSITSARPLGRGRSMYPRGVVAIAITSPPRLEARLPSRLAGLLTRQRLLRPAHQAAANVRAVLCQRLRDLCLANAVEVADRPVELLQGVRRGAPVAVRFFLLRGSSLAVVLSHSQPPRRPSPCRPSPSSGSSSLPCTPAARVV